MSIQSDYSMYSTTAPIEHRISSMSIAVPVKHHENPTEYAINRFSQKYDSYQGLLYRNEAHRRRLSSTGEGSGDSSTTVSGSSYGEREDGSEGREEHDDIDHHHHHHEKYEDDNRKPLLDGQVTEMEKQQVETFFRGLKTEVINFFVSY